MRLARGRQGALRPIRASWAGAYNGEGVVYVLRLSVAFYVYGLNKAYGNIAAIFYGLSTSPASREYGGRYRGASTGTVFGKTEYGWGAAPAHPHARPARKFQISILSLMMF